MFKFFARSRKQQNRFRPCVEELERRDVPTYLSFVPDGAAGFASQPVWRDLATNLNIGRLPNATDIIQVNTGLVMDVDLHVMGLQLIGNIEVGNHTLEVGSATGIQGAATFLMYANASITMTHENSTVLISGHTQAGIWDSAGIEGGKGKLSLQHGTILTLYSENYDTISLDTEVRIGTDSPNAIRSELILTGKASINLGEGFIDVGQSGSLRLYNAAEASITSTSGLPINNKGYIIYAGDDLLTLGMGIRNVAGTSIIKTIGNPLSEEDGLVINDPFHNGSIIQTAGITEFQGGSVVGLNDGYKQSGGELRLNATPFNSAIDTVGDFTITGGNVYTGWNGEYILNQSVSWHNEGSITLSSSVTLWIKIAVTEVATGADRIFTSGDFTCGGATLRVEDMNECGEGEEFEPIIADEDLMGSFGLLLYGWNGNTALNDGGFSWDYVRESTLVDYDYFSLRKEGSGEGGSGGEETIGF